MSTITNQTAFFQACAKGDLTTAKRLVRDSNASSLNEWRTPDNKTCIHAAALAGNADILVVLADKLSTDLGELIKKADNQGNTALHLALRNDREEPLKDRVDLIKLLVRLDSSLCDCANRESETPLKLAVSLGFEEAMEILITCTSNALHCIVELNQLKLVRYLIKRKVDLSNLINQPYQPTPNSPPQINYPTNPPGSPPTNLPIHVRDQQHDYPIVRQGDAPLHIAARNKYGYMVNLLLKVPGMDKLTRNSEDKTPFEIAREVTEYDESFRIIRELSNYGRRPKPFMYCTPKASHRKNEKARLLIKKAYEQRRNAELVVAALLATLTCAAAFTVPGGFDSDNKTEKFQGSPILMSSFSFKLFVIFNCIAFFQALFVCIMWETSIDFNTGNKMLFMSVNTMVTCCSLGFTSFGFIAAVYSMLARKVQTFSWVIVGYLIFLAIGGGLLTCALGLHIGVKRARFNRLCGGSCILDEIAEGLWTRAERCGLLDLYRLAERFSHELIIGNVKLSGGAS